MTTLNERIAQKLREHANELAKAGHNLYRVRAFRSAAMAILALPGNVAELYARGGTPELERVPGIGKSLASTIAGFLTVAALNDGTLAA
jgi:DNA polymerase (family 10)